ncbi:hypothetical protein TH5_02990 [Thalassospira xianhensis MCCC 1A02616]|uniref:ABC transporter ATP-binding protein n=1 Tax=Thalassospira xianhensis MCCC 1A02616 TaxID=1177929 RepID=A0A367UH79_9PROT|nr:hypothetical protein TH5_02990 [Thalassospira xianhensis MCCC 1A02616]
MIKIIWRLLSLRERIVSGFLVVGVLIAALLDAAGVASIVPFLTLLSDPSAIEKHETLMRVYEYSGYDTPHEFLFLLGWGTLALVVTSSILQAVSQYTQIHFGEMRRVSLSGRLLKKYLSQSYGFFLSQHSSNITRYLLSEVNVVTGRCIVPLILLVANSIHAVILVALIFWLEPLIALGATLFIGGSFLVIFLFMRNRITELGTKRMEASRRCFMIASDAINGIKDVKLYNLESAFIHRFDRGITEFSNYNASNEVASIFPRFSIQILVFSGMMVALMFLLKDNRDLSHSLPTMGLLVFAGTRLLPKFQTIYQCIVRIRFGSPALRKLEEHLTMSENDWTKEKIEPLFPSKEITLSGVSFFYPESDKPAVHNLDLIIPVHHTVGLIGPSGAGKTTVIDLLLSLYPPSSGHLKVDGEVINAVNERRWQQALGYVPQDIFLLDSSIKENIAFGVPLDEIDESLVKHVARQANIHDFIIEHLPEGYDTKVGERGIRLSGGQKQRIGIARALYRQPAVLVFDEATSAVDNITEREIVKTLTEIGEEKTIIMIAHRLDTVRNCDCIYLMDKGKVVASGTYDDLAKHDPRFREMLGESASNIF